MKLTQHLVKAAVVLCSLKGREPLCVSHDLTGLLMGVLGWGALFSSSSHWFLSEGMVVISWWRNALH